VQDSVIDAECPMHIKFSCRDGLVTSQTNKVGLWHWHTGIHCRDICDNCGTKDSKDCSTEHHQCHTSSCTELSASHHQSSNPRTAL